jgi:8-oxo-dGTP diphosphatase
MTTHVAAGIIIQNDKILIAERPKGTSFAGFWEFPGGKAEPGETSQEALIRELQEEVGITPIHSSHFTTVSHERLILDFWWVTQFTGAAHGAENQRIAWVHPNELSRYTFPETNTPIIHHLLTKGPSL